MQDTLTPQQRTAIRQAAQAAADDGRYRIELYTDYSGRGMYGQTCLGVETDEPNTAAVFLVELAILLADPSSSTGGDPELARELAAATARDSLGRGVITYWPGIGWGDDSEDEDE